MSYLKIFMICVVWATVFVLPLMCSSTSLDGNDICFIWLEKFCFFFALTLPFDFRDKDSDITQGVKTFANTLSAKVLRVSIASGVFLALVFIAILYTMDIYSLWLSVILGLFYWWLLIMATKGLKSQDEMYYAGWLDAMIMINGLIYIIST